MKFLLLSLLSFSAFASSGINVKVSDGGLATCKTKADIQRNKFGVYKAGLKSITVEDEIAAVKIDVSFLSCVENDGQVGFLEVRPYDSFSYQTVSLSTGISTIQAQAEMIKMISYRDGIYKKIADIQLSNEEKQTVKLELKLQDLLSEEEITALQEGKVVTGNFDYTIQKTIRIENQKRSHLINFGAFRIHFKANLDNNNQVNIIAVK